MYLQTAIKVTGLKNTIPRRRITTTASNTTTVRSNGFSRNWCCWFTPTTSNQHYLNLNQINNRYNSTVFGRTYTTKVPKDRKYTKSHEWIKVQEGRGTVGITSHASEALGDIVFVELPEVGRRYEKSDPFAAVESVKAASDIYIPMGGAVEEVNSEIVNTPNLVNESPFDKGWLVKISVDDDTQHTQLLSSEEYEKWLEDEKK